MAVRVCVVGSVNADLTYSVGSLPRPGQTVIASALSTSPGGNGGNQAVAAARAGADVQLVAALGTDAAAEQLRAHLGANSVGLAGVRSVPGPSGSAAIIVDAGAENCIVVAPGANAHLSLNSAAIRSIIADSDVVLIQLEIPIDTVTAAARVGREAGSAVIVNASPTPDHHTVALLAELADVVVVNETESEDWLTEGRSPVAHLVITRGSRGASLIAGGERRDVTAPAVEPVDTTGPAMCSPACWRRRGGTEPTTRCGGRARRAHWRRWCTAPVTVRRRQRPSTTSWRRPDPGLAPANSSAFSEYRFRCTICRMQAAIGIDALSRFGCALSDPTRTEILLILREGPGYPSELADRIGVSRQTLSNHLACLRGCGLVTVAAEGRRSRYDLADPRIAHALNDLVGLVLAVDPACC